MTSRAGPYMSQITENRKVEIRKPLIFQHVIFSFGLKNATLRQNPRGRSALGGLFDGGEGFGQHVFGVTHPLVQLFLGPAL